MQNLAYQLNFTLEDQKTPPASRDIRGNTDLCPGCGHELFGPDAEACSRQSWGAFWEIVGFSHIEPVCGSCGEHLHGVFHDARE